MLVHFTLYQLFHLFFLYAFLGWCTEVCYAALAEGRFTNRGFLNGPLCPIYGFGVLLTVVLHRLADKPDRAVFLAGASRRPLPRTQWRCSWTTTTEMNGSRPCTRALLSFGERK